MSDLRRIAIDIQALQGYSSRGRGIGRYIFEQVKAIVAAHPDRIHSLLVNPRRGLPPEIESFLETGLVRAHTSEAPAVNGETPDTYYVTSPFEFDLTLDEIWPTWARQASVETVVTLYDLIPMLFPEQYLEGPIWASIHWARREFVRQADLLLCISEATATDAIRLFDLSERKAVNIGTGVSDHFTPPVDRECAMANAIAMVPGLRPGFFMYTGGIDYRKNIEGLLRAFSMVPVRLRGDRQLVIVCRVLENERDMLHSLASDLGIDDALLLTGFVPDSTLAMLYQSTDLFIFPSIYEGFGLPIAEAILSGSLAIASDSSSMVELVLDPTLRFDPEDSSDIARCIAHTLELSDTESLRVAQHEHVAEQFRWDRVADRTLHEIDRLPRVSPITDSIRRPRIAFVTPIPPAESGIADYSWRLIHALAEYVDVDVVPEDPGSSAIPQSSKVEIVSGPGLIERDRLVEYANVVYVMGNSSHHEQAYELMGQRRGVVMLHEARMTGFFEWYGRHIGHGPDWFQSLLHHEYQGITPSLGDDGWLTWADASEAGLYLLGPIIDRADRVLTTSAFTAEIASLHRPDRTSDIVDIGFAYPPAEAGDVRSDVEWIATFGYQHEIKATDVILEAFARLADAYPAINLAIVGDVAAELLPTLKESIAALGLEERVVRTSRIDIELYETWLRQTDIAVQLRRATNGEVSAAVGDCLRFGIPTLVTALGPAIDLPDDAVVKMSADCAVSELADGIRSVITSETLRRNLSLNSAEFVSDNGFDRSAQRLLAALGVTQQPAGLHKTVR